MKEDASKAAPLRAAHVLPVRGKPCSRSGASGDSLLRVPPRHPLLQTPLRPMVRLWRGIPVRNFLRLGGCGPERHREGPSNFLHSIMVSPQDAPSMGAILARQSWVVSVTVGRRHAGQGALPESCDAFFGSSATEGAPEEGPNPAREGPTSRARSTPKSRRSLRIWKRLPSQLPSTAGQQRSSMDGKTEKRERVGCGLRARKLHCQHSAVQRLMISASTIRNPGTSTFVSC